MGINTLKSYTDDDKTREALARAGSERTLHEIYGIFYGAVAAPEPSDPVEQVSMIFDDEAAAEVSEEDADNARNNLLSLWNFIVRWDPKKDPFYFPEQEYPATYQGVLQHLKDDAALVQYFIAGLNIGGTEEKDFSEDAVDAMHELMKASSRLEKNIAVCEALKPTAADEDPDATAEMLDTLEDILADCIARVAMGLKKRGNALAKREA